MTRKTVLLTIAVSSAVWAFSGSSFGTTGTPKVHPWVELSVSRCKHVSRKRKDSVDRQLLSDLFELERELGVPKKYRGMAVAKACIETGYQPKKRGDCWGKDGYCYARGIVQLWPWVLKFGIDRENPEQAVRFLLGRIKLGAKTKVRKYCPHIKSKDARWRVAWVRVNRGPFIKGKDGKVTHRCSGTPHGLTQLRKWQRLRKWKIAKGISFAAVRLDSRRRVRLCRDTDPSRCGERSCRR